MKLARRAALALAALLAACGGTESKPSSTPDTFALTVAGTTTTFRDDSATTSIFASGSGGNTVVYVNDTGVNVTLTLPAGATGSVSGTFTAVIGGHSCSGAVTATVGTSGTTFGSHVTGSFASTSLGCNVAPNPQAFAASFDVTHL